MLEQLKQALLQGFMALRKSIHGKIDRESEKIVTAVNSNNTALVEIDHKVAGLASEIDRALAQTTASVERIASASTAGNDHVATALQGVTMGLSEIRDALRQQGDAGGTSPLFSAAELAELEKVE